jgi:hypothetical protein
MGFDLSNYETVEQRLVRWWAAYPNGRVYTCMMNYTGDACVFYCELYADKDDKVPVATGYAEEIKSDRGVNATSFVENCETSAIGRAIANCPLQAPASGPRPSRNEMQKVERLSTPTDIRQNPVHIPSGAFATPKQIGYIKKLAKDKGMDDLALLEMIQLNLDDDSAVLELLKSHEASKIIERLK